MIYITHKINYNVNGSADKQKKIRNQCQISNVHVIKIGIYKKKKKIQ